MPSTNRYARDWGVARPGEENLLQRPQLLIAAIMVALVLLATALAVTAAQIAGTIDAAVLEAEHARAARTAAAYSRRFGPLQPGSIAELGELLSLDGLRMVAGEAAGPGETRLALLPGQGPEGSALVWRPRLYGSEAYAAFAPKRLPIGVFAVLGLVLMLFYLNRFAADIETRRKAAHELAGRDALTGLANRMGFERALNERFAFLARPFTLYCLDLDGFKAVNDRLGHGAGDVVLQAVAQRLRQILDADTLVARLGGDEFAVLLDGDWTLESLEALAHRMRASICMPFPIAGTKVRIGVSIGIAEAPGQASSPQGLVAIADAALYRAKSGQGDGVCFGSLGERVPRPSRVGEASDAA